MRSQSLLACATKGWNFGAPAAAVGRMTVPRRLAARGHRTWVRDCGMHERGLLHSAPARRQRSAPKPAHCL